MDVVTKHLWLNYDKDACLLIQHQCVSECSPSLSLTGADPGFPVGGGANPLGGAPTYDSVKFSQKLHEIEKILDRGGGGGARVRYSCSENRKAYKEMCRKYDDNIIGQVMESILEHHKDKDILYTLNEEAEGVFEVITDKLNDQFILKYTSSSQISASQPDLDNTEKSELSVRTKATEIIGRLTCMLWVYCKG